MGLIARQLIRFRSCMIRNKLRISPGFVLVLSFAAYFGDPVVLGWVLLAAVLHEGGHLLAAKGIGLSVRHLALDFTGANLDFYRKTTSYAQDLLLCLSGPAVNFFFVTLSVLFHWNPLFLAAHLLLGIFNLMPIIPLDGGKALYAFLSGVWNPFLAGRILSALSVLIAVGVSLSGLWVFLQLDGPPNLLLLGLWLLFSALCSCNLHHFPIK